MIIRKPLVWLNSDAFISFFEQPPEWDAPVLASTVPVSTIATLFHNESATFRRTQIGLRPGSAALETRVYLYLQTW